MNTCEWGILSMVVVWWHWLLCDVYVYHCTPWTYEVWTFSIGVFPQKTRKIVRGEPLVDGEALPIHIIDTKKIQKVVICQSLKLFLSPPYVPEEGYFRILVFWHWVTSFQCITCNPGFLTCFRQVDQVDLPKTWVFSSSLLIFLEFFFFPFSSI